VHVLNVRWVEAVIHSLHYTNNRLSAIRRGLLVAAGE
jgi:hypothetical protein